MPDKERLQYRRLYFAVYDFIGCYEAFLDTRDITTNKRCNDAYNWLQAALQDLDTFCKI